MKYIYENRGIRRGGQCAPTVKFILSLHCHNFGNFTSEILPLPGSLPSMRLKHSERPSLRVSPVLALPALRISLSVRAIFWRQGFRGKLTGSPESQHLT